MSDSTFSKDQVAALEQILGVKLPQEGFTLEVRPIVSALDEGQLDGVVGGLLPAVAQASPLPVASNAAQVQLPTLRWSAKI
jgi:hypothetical protein